MGINWNFKKKAVAQGSSNGFWYDITDGGYVRPEEVLADPEQVTQIRGAIALLRSFETALESNGLLNEF